MQDLRNYAETIDQFNLLNLAQILIGVAKS